MESTDETVKCECGTTEKPVSSFGDFICKISCSNVKDMIRRFEGVETADGPLIMSESAEPIINKQQPKHSTSTDNAIERRIIYEEQETCPQRAVQASIRQYVLQQSFIRPREKISEKKSYFEHSLSKSNSNQKQESISSGSIPFSYQTDNDNIVYPSKTTICKTDYGVRIIVDINFDKLTKFENWHGSRIETDLPNSEILAEFQKKSIK